MPTLDQLLRATSRTFALGIERLPLPLRDEVKVAYLVLRISDYLEDNESMAAARKSELLHRWCAVLRQDADLDGLEDDLLAAVEEDHAMPDAEAARHVAQVVRALAGLDARARSVIATHAGDATLGMARWAERGPDFATEADLDDYMHEVAGRVGYLLTELFAFHSRAVAQHHRDMMGLGREFGLGLQTVNVIRGLHEDPERGWVFVPREFMERAEASIEALFDASAPAAGLRVLALLTGKADRHLAAARRYVSVIERRHHRIRVFCLLPLLFAVRTVALSRGNPLVFTREVKITRDEVARIARGATMWGWSNLWIRRACARLETSPAP